MFRKIHSNRDSSVTVYSEVKIILAAYLVVFRKKSNAFFTKYPKVTFCSMVVLLVISGIMAFTVMRNHEKPKPIAQPDLSFKRIDSVLLLLKKQQKP